MQQHGSKYFTCRPHPLPPGVGSKVQHFSFSEHMVILHIKLNGVMNAATCKHMFFPYTHPRPPEVGSKVKYFFESYAAYQIKGNGV